MADREVRYTRTVNVDTLSRKVVCLKDKVQELRKKMTKTLEIQSSKIGVLTTLVKSHRLALPTAVPLQADPPDLTTPLPQHWKATTNNHHPRPLTDSKLDTQTTQQRKIWQEMRPGHCSARPTTLPPVPLVTRNQSSSPHPVLAKSLQHHQPPDSTSLEDITRPSQTSPDTNSLIDIADQERTDWIGKARESSVLLGRNFF